MANDDTNTMGVINTTAPFKLQDTIALTPKNAKSGRDLGVLVSDKHQLYQSDDNYIDVIDKTSNKIVKQYTTDLPATKATKDMIYDPSTKLVWVGTTGNQVIVLNVDTGKMTDVTTQSGQDQLAWDPASKMLFLGSKTDPWKSLTWPLNSQLVPIPWRQGFTPWMWTRTSTLFTPI